MPLLSVRHLSTGFPFGDRWIPAVQDVSFDIARGETLALVGESGSGKSLTAYSLLRLVPPPGRILSGSIELEGRNLMDLPESEMERVRGAKISLIFQEPMSALNPVLTIGSQLVEAMTVHGLGGANPRVTALEILSTVRMDDPARRFAEYPHQLSGGLRQRALIALALCCRPSLIVADEPTTALDVTIQAEILNLLRQLKHDFGLSLLLITHDLGVAARTPRTSPAVRRRRRRGATRTAERTRIPAASVAATAPALRWARAGGRCGSNRASRAATPACTDARAS